MARVVLIRKVQEVNDASDVTVVFVAFVIIMLLNSHSSFRQHALVRGTSIAPFAFSAARGE